MCVYLCLIFTTTPIYTTEKPYQTQSKVRIFLPIENKAVTPSIQVWSIWDIAWLWDQYNLTWMQNLPTTNMWPESATLLFQIRSQPYISSLTCILEV